MRVHHRDMRRSWIAPRVLIALLLGACAGAGPIGDAGTPTPTEQPPRANVRGRDVRLVKDHGIDSEVGHPAPEVAPRSPLDLVVDDCEGLKLFFVDDALIDSESHLVILDWWDPGVEANRTLTIMTDSPFCAAHPDMRRQYLDP